MWLRPKTTALDPEERAVLQRLWDYFKQHRVWPQLAERLRVEFDERGQDFDEARKQWTHIYVNTNDSSTSQGSMSAGLDDLLYLPEVRELFSPLPRLLKLAAERLKKNPTYDRNLDEPRITLGDLESIWGNAEQARLVATLIENTSLELLSWAGRDETGTYFSPRVQVFRFKDVTTLEEIEQQPEREPLPALSMPPSGIYQQVLWALHQYCVREFRWPAPGRFVAEQLDELGYTATALRVLHPDFIANDPHFRGKTEMEPTISCIQWVTSQREQHLLVELIQAMVEQYKKAFRENADEQGQHQVSLADMAGRLSTSVERLAPLMQYIKDEPWGRVELRGASPDEWQLFWDKRIFEFRKVENWSGYLKKRDELNPGRLRDQRPSYTPPLMSSGIVVEKELGLLEMLQSQAIAEVEPFRRLFISFAGQDEALAEALADLLHRGCRVPEELITCTAWNDIEGGEDIQEHLRMALRESALVLPLVSKNFYNSFYAVLELGAAWQLGKPILPVLVPPMGVDNLKSVLAHKKAYHIGEATDLDKLNDRIRRELKTDSRTDEWNRRRDRFLKEIAGELVQRQSGK
jgi:hypothetical protein